MMTAAPAQVVAGGCVDQISQPSSTAQISWV